MELPFSREGLDADVEYKNGKLVIKMNQYLALAKGDSIVLDLNILGLRKDVDTVWAEKQKLEKNS